MLKNLAPSAIESGHYNQEDFDILTDCLAAAEKYLKSHYVYNLKLHSKVASHCLSHCLSDVKTKEFSHSCGEEHNEVCENCQLIPDIVQVLEGVLKTLKDSNHFPDQISFDEASFDLHDAHKKIWNLMSHLMRNHMSQKEWEDMLQEGKPHRALMTMDWAMKGLPKKFRESTKDWYAQAGWYVYYRYI